MIRELRLPFVHFSHKTVYMCFKHDIIDLSKQNNQIGEIKCLKLLTSSKLLKTF
ncbi:hypothetical protein [Escherichia phage FL31]